MNLYINRNRLFTYLKIVERLLKMYWRKEYDLGVQVNRSVYVNHVTCDVIDDGITWHKRRTYIDVNDIRDHDRSQTLKSDEVK